MGVVPLLYCSVMCIALLLSLFTIYVLLIHSIWIQGFRSIPLLVYHCTIVVFKTFINVSNILAPKEYSRYTLVDIKAWSWFTSACLRMITLYSYYVLWYFSSVWSTRSYLVVPSLVTRDSLPLSWLVTRSLSRDPQRPSACCTWFSGQGPWQNSVRVQRHWSTSSKLPSLMYNPSKPRPPVEGYRVRRG